ncbi:uncharacterized protein LOC114247437 [Bombyx mandarina]|uniref:Uncharacterized protein n=2 Tax=Bombyx TaxID=7090 RepID=A0A8R1WFY4_BOMMO|nr:uncharacterized protein LOC101742245 [Bombyx mori]XP_028036210.1 uncharacterized protein LOC114247437 [Bombyx mandarina]
MPSPLTQRQLRRRSLYTSLYYATRAIDEIASDMQTDRCRWSRSLLGHSFSMPPLSSSERNDCGTVNFFKAWLIEHEEAQVMLASFLVVIGLWWLLRAVLTLLVNLIIPVLVVVLAVVCVPQLRAPLLGQNYPALANLLRSILMKMAENIKT